MRDCKLFKNWLEEFVNVECFFFGNKTKTCLHDEINDWMCPWQGEPPVMTEGSRQRAVEIGRASCRERV